MTVSIIPLARVVFNGLIDKLDEGTRCIEALLELDPWIGTSAGNRCRFCGGVWPGHEVDCPRQRAERYVGSLSVEEEE